MRRSVSISLALSALLAAAACVAPAKEPSVVGQYLSGRLAASVNDVDDAADAFAHAETEAQGALQLRRDAFFFQLAAGDMADAFVLAERLAADPDSGDDGLARVALAAKNIKAGAYGAARANIREGVETGYLTATINVIDAWAAAGEGGAAAGYERLSVPIAEEFRLFNPLHAALLAELAGETEKARDHYQLSVRTFGGPVARAAFGAFLERTGDETAAREFYELLASDPGPGRQTARQGLKRLNTGAPPPEMSITTPAQGAAVAYFSLGAAILEQSASRRNAALRAGFNVGDANYNLPLALTQLALYLDPELDDAKRLAGSILNLYGDNEGAIAKFSRIRQTSPYWEQAQIETAIGLAALDRPNDGVNMLRSTVAKDPEALEARLALANLLAAEQRHADAVKALDGLIAQLGDEPEPDAWRYYLTRAASLLELDEWPRAETDLKIAVDLAPEEATALNYLGYMWAERGENLDEAFALIEKAVSLQPDSGAIIDSLGWAHYQRGNYSEAVGHLEHAASIEAGDPTITDHLGDVYWRLGRKIEARYQWRRVLELEPDADLAETVRGKLKNGLGDDGA